MRFAPTCVLFFLVACAPRLDVGAPCDLATDCPTPLVCRYGRCRTACREARDCPIGLRCVIDGNGGSACTLETEEACDIARPCALGLRCDLSGECRSRCTNDSECTASGRCELMSCVEPSAGEDAGAPDAGGADTPTCVPGAMVCDNGRFDRCDLELDFAEIAAVMTGGSTGELDVLGTHELPPQPWPVDGGGSPLPPEIALALTRRGFGIVGHITGDSTREVRTNHFATADLASEAPIASGATITDAITLALAENGDEVTGFVLLSDPGSSATSGFQLTFVADPSGTQSSISAGPMPPLTSGHLAIIGGFSSILGTDLPIYYLTREVFADTTEVIGAIDEGLGMSTYRATRTAPLGPSRTLESSGSAGRLAVFRDSGPTVGIWDVERTQPLDELGRIAPTDLALHDVGAAGAPAIALAHENGTDYLLAVPVIVDDAGAPVGYTRFFDVVCPAVGACNRPIDRRVDLQSRNGRVPAAVRLASLLGGGQALAVLEPTEGGETTVRLRFLDSALLPTTNELVGSIVPAATSPTTEDIVAIEVRAVTDGAVVTVVVAALVRDYVRRQDHIVLGGVQACIAR